MSHEDVMNVCFLLIGVILGLIGGAFIQDVARMFGAIVDAFWHARERDKSGSTESPQPSAGEQP